MIINTGNRTDIPAYFSKWFYNRIKDGYVCVRNPYYFNQITKYRLSPDVVDCLAFCTKNPEAFLSRIDEIKHFSQFWFVTITLYGKDIEPNVPSKEKVIEGFEKMASSLSGYTNYCIISFVDLYESTKSNFINIKEVSYEERNILAKEFVSIGEKYNIRIKTCLEGKEFSKYGVDCSGCMTKPAIERAINNNIKVSTNKIATREGCNCLLGNDIGVYNTCDHGCIYCYANYNHTIVKDSVKNHNPNAPLLIGSIMDDDVIKDAKKVI